jgi:hypothetical protein
MTNEKWNRYVEHTRKLASEVEESRWGDLNILKIARAFCVPRDLASNPYEAPGGQGADVP